jgi:hypothetical protein
MFPPPPPPPARGGGRRVAVIGGVVVAAALVLSLVLVAGGDDDTDEAGPPGPGQSAGGEEVPGEEEPGDATPREEAPEDEGGDPSGEFTSGRAGGVILPLLSGWEESEATEGVAVTTGSYPCPGDPETACVDGGAFMYVIPGSEAAGAEDLARADIGEHVTQAYGSAVFGALTDSEEVLAEEVTVAGQEGYRIRTHVRTESGIAGYVESVAFPAPDGSGLILLRLSVDTEGQDPAPEEMDAIVFGARTASGGGPGTDV